MNIKTERVWIGITKQYTNEDQCLTRKREKQAMRREEGD
jgi:hypothetical protein